LGVTVDKKVLEQATKCKPTFSYLKEETPHCEAIRKVFSNLLKKICWRSPRKLDRFSLDFCIMKFEERRRIQEENARLQAINIFQIIIVPDSAGRDNYDFQ